MNEDAGRDRLVRNLLIGAVVVVVLFLVALLVALGFGLQWYLSPKTDLTIVQRRDLVQGMASAGQALAVFLTGTVGLIGLFFTWQNTSQARKSTRQTLELTRRGQITERFTQAIDQLGATEGGEKNLEIRLGGIYALERTAREDEAYHWPIMEVLTSYVRRHAARKPEEESGENAAAPPEPDIQAILNVIGRRSEYHRTDKKVEYGTIDLSNTNLRGVDLRRAYLLGANLWKADLQGAYLSSANLQGANLVEANLRRADLTRANLQEAELQRADLQQQAIVINANLQGAVLENAKLQGANFAHAELQRAELRRAKLKDAFFREAQLQAADFRDTDLTVAQLDGAHWDESTRFSSELRIRLRTIEDLRARLPLLEAAWRRAREEGTPEGKQREEQLRAELLEIPPRIEALRRASPE